MNSPEWLERKACRPEHAALFFPAGYTYDGGRVDYAPALSICGRCGRCEALAECRADAIAHGDIVGGHTMHGQVVGGCAPKARAKVDKPMRQCSLDGCGRWFTVRRGANMYCSPECAVEGRRVGQRKNYHRHKAAS